jgi:hypothetical protein
MIFAWPDFVERESPRCGIGCKTLRSRLRCRSRLSSAGEPQAGSDFSVPILALAQNVAFSSITPHRWGWKAFESPGVEPVFANKDQAIDLG